MPYETTEVFTGGSSDRAVRNYEAYYEDGSTRRLEGVLFAIEVRKEFMKSPSGRKIYTGEVERSPMWIGLDLVEGMPRDVRKFPGYQGIRRRADPD